MKKLLFIALCLFLYNSSAWAVDCNRTVEEDTAQVIYNCEDNDSLTVNSGVTIEHQNANYRPVEANNHDNVTIDNYGTITNTNYNTAVDITNSSNITIYNRTGATIYSHKSGAIRMTKTDGDINIYNYGTIESRTHGAIHNYAESISGDIYIENSGTIRTSNTGIGGLSAGRHLGSVAIEGDDDHTGTFTLVNSGTIDVEGSNPFPAVRVNNSYANIITTSGTVSGGPETSGSPNSAGMDIVVEKCSSADKMDYCDGKAETTTINLDGEAAFSKGIDLNGTKVNIVLKEGLKRDVTVRIFDYVEESSDYLTITSEGNDTYTLSAETLTFDDGSANVYGSTIDVKDATTNKPFVGHSDSETREEYNAGTDGILTILGEDLEVKNNNKKYRAENTLTKLRGLFGAANYVGGKWPDYCTTIDPEETENELNEICNQRFVKLFHSYQKRDGVYDGTSFGAVGMLSPIEWKGSPIISNIFVGYANQKGDFNNGEYLGGDNYVLGVKNTYENKGFRASFTPMMGVNDLGIIDFDTDKVEKKAANFLSEFAAVNGKISKKIGTGEDRFLNISVDGTYGLQRFPQYISKFTDGDLSVDESIEQLLSGGFEVSYTEALPGNFVIKPYMGASLNRNLNDAINITARNKNADMTNDHQETWSGYHVGVSLIKEVKGLNFDLDLMYGNEDGLINKIAAFSLTKSFGKAKVKTAVLEKKPDFPKIDGSLTTQDYDKDLKELEALRNLNKKLKADNAVLKTQNEKLKLLAEKVLQQDKAKEKLVIELLKENEKIKLNNQIFKNRILDNENEALLRSIEEEAKKSESNKFELLYFLALYIVTVLLLTSLFTSFYKKIRYRSSRQTVIS